MGVRSRVGWLLNGSARHDAAVRDLGAQVSDLQHKVEALTQVVARLDTTLPKVEIDATTSVTALDAMKQQLRTITDDLGDRVGAISARLDSLQ